MYGQKLSEPQELERICREFPGLDVSLLACTSKALKALGMAHKALAEFEYTPEQRADVERMRKDLAREKARDLNMETAQDLAACGGDVERIMAIMASTDALERDHVSSMAYLEDELAKLSSAADTAAKSAYADTMKTVPGNNASGSSERQNVIDHVIKRPVNNHALYVAVVSERQFRLWENNRDRYTLHFDTADFDVTFSAKTQSLCGKIAYTYQKFGVDALLEHLRRDKGHFADINAGGLDNITVCPGSVSEWEMRAKAHTNDLTEKETDNG